jgi:hypothetical protein
MYPGGIADKTGNRFEARWLTRQMLGLLAGAAISIMVEKIGEGDEGFEFLVERPDTAEWHQCKRQTSETSWTIMALAREAIIKNFSAKLQLSPSHRCVFVSTYIAKQVKLLQEKRAYAPTLAEFENILSKDETAYWQQLHDKLGFSGDAALAWIDRCEFHTLSEDFLESVDASHGAKLPFSFRPRPVVCWRLKASRKRPLVQVTRCDRSWAVSRMAALRRSSEENRLLFKWAGVTASAPSPAPRALNDASDQPLRATIRCSSPAKPRAVRCLRITPMKSYASPDLGTNQ